MVPAPVAVVGARGKTGRAVTASLRRRGVSTRSLGRVELTDPVGALRGCETIYLIAPNLHPDEPAFVERILDAAVGAGTTRVVYHSVVSPHAPSMPHHLGKAVSEDLIRRSSLSWTLLQPGCYLQNFLPALSDPRPALRVPYATTRQFTFVDLLDVADAATEVIVGGAHATDRHEGATYELGGSERTTLDDLARLAQQILGTEVPAERIDPADWAAAQDAVRGPERIGDREREWLSAMFDYYDHHGLLCGSVPLEALLARQPMTVELALRRDLRPPSAPLATIARI